MYVVELELSQRQSEADQQRLWNDLSAHIATVHARHPDVATGSSSDLAVSAANQWSHLLAEGHLSNRHIAGLSSSLQSYASYSAQPSRLADVCNTGSKAGMLCSFL